MLTAPDWALGSQYLRENAPELIPFIDKYGVCTLQPEIFRHAFNRHYLPAASAGGQPCNG